MKHLTTVAVLILWASILTSAQQERPLSPPGTATAMVGGEWVKDAAGATVYQGGKWIEVTYGRPMLRQRTNIFGAGADYGVAVRAGADLWRAGANNTTVLKTEVPLAFAGKTVPAGEYGLLIELRSPTQWTMVLTSQPRQPQFDANNKTDLIGATNYNPKFDVARVPMQVDSKAASKLDQLTIFFCDVTKTSGKLAIAWENTVATVEFSVR
jgi:Protein of unknown function (DUF2911)